MGLRKTGKELANPELEIEAEDEFESVVAEFGDGVEITGRVYRITSPSDSLGKPAFEAVGKVFEHVDDDFVGRNFGSGTYRVKYTIKNNTRSVQRNETFHIGKEYDKFCKAKAQAVDAAPVAKLGGLDLGGILGGITVEKLAIVGTVLGKIKEFLAPPQPQVDMTKLLEVMLTNNRQQNVSDAVLVKALDGMQRNNTPPSISQQIAEFKAMKEAFGELDEENEEKGDSMSFLLEKAFEYLPALLQQKNNDYRAVGREVRENPLVKSIINSDPELTKKFFERAVSTYGVEAANQLAAGFGYQVTQQQPQPQAATNGENIG